MTTPTSWACISATGYVALPSAWCRPASPSRVVRTTPAHPLDECVPARWAAVLPNPVSRRASSDDLPSELLFEALVVSAPTGATPGRKHTSTDRLQPWQTSLALAWSPSSSSVASSTPTDAARSTPSGARRLARPVVHRYARYTFSNRSDDIRLSLHRRLRPPRDQLASDEQVERRHLASGRRGGHGPPRRTEALSARSGIRTRTPFRTMAFEATMYAIPSSGPDRRG